MDLPNLKLSYPRVMMVSDEPITKDNPGFKRVVWAYNPRFRFAYMTYNRQIDSITQLDTIAPITQDGEGVRSGRWGGGGFVFAKDIPEIEIELTLQEIADKFDLDVKQIRIKK